MDSGKFVTAGLVLRQTATKESDYILTVLTADGILSVNADGVDVVHVELPPGNSMVFVRKPSAAAVPSVKVITWP